MDVRPSMLRGYLPRRVVREGERERPGEVDSQTDQRIVDEGGSTKWPSSTTHSSPALNPGEVNYTDQRKQVLLSAGCFCLSALEESTTRLVRQFSELFSELARASDSRNLQIYQTRTFQWARLFKGRARPD